MVEIIDFHKDNSKKEQLTRIRPGAPGFDFPSRRLYGYGVWRLENEIPLLGVSGEDCDFILMILYSMSQLIRKQIKRSIVL